MWRLDYAIARLSQIVMSCAGRMSPVEDIPDVSKLMPFTEEPVATEADMKRMFGVKD